jgi:hypothetical protein
MAAIEAEVIPTVDFDNTSLYWGTGASSWDSMVYGDSLEKEDDKPVTQGVCLART